MEWICLGKSQAAKSITVSEYFISVSNKSISLELPQKYLNQSRGVLSHPQHLFLFLLCLLTDNSTALCLLYLVNKVVALACLHFNSPGHCSRVKLLVCLHSPPTLPPFSSPIQHLKCLLLPLRLLKARELEEEAKEWSVSSPLHFYDQRHLLGLQPTDLGTGTSEQAPSATAIPEARQQAGAGALCWCSGEYECICVWVYHPELLGRVLHFNEHLCSRGALVEMLLVFSRSFGVGQCNRCLCLHVFVMKPVRMC